MLMMADKASSKFVSEAIFNIASVLSEDSYRSQNKITDAAFVIECLGFGFFCLKPLKTILDHPLKPLGAPDFG